MPSRKKKTAKRENGVGTVNQQKNGNYRWRATIGLTVHGVPIRKSGTEPTRKEAMDAMRAVIDKASRGQMPIPDRITVGDYLDQWLEQKKQTLAPKSVSNYGGIIKRQIKPVLGRIALQKLTPLHLHSLYVGMSEKGLRDTQRQVHSLILHPALEYARRLRVISENPCDNVKPRLRQTIKIDKQHALSPQEVGRLLPVLRQDRWGLIFEFLLHTGMRRAELCALRWADVDLEACTVAIQENRTVVDGQPQTGEPKTEKSRRVIHLSPEALECLRRQQASQALECRALAPGPMPGHAKGKERRRPWQNSGYVFTQICGTPLHPDTLSRYLKRFCQDAGVRQEKDVKAATNHMMRHTFASLMLRAKVPLEVVSQILGHSRPSFTADVYRYVYADERAAYAISLSALLEVQPGTPALPASA